MHMHCPYLGCICAAQLCQGLDPQAGQGAAKAETERQKESGLSTACKRQEYSGRRLVMSYQSSMRFVEFTLHSFHFLFNKDVPCRWAKSLTIRPNNTSKIGIGYFYLGKHLD